MPTSTSLHIKGEKERKGDMAGHIGRSTILAVESVMESATTRRIPSRMPPSSSHLALPTYIILLARMYHVYSHSAWHDMAGQGKTRQDTGRRAQGMLRCTVPSTDRTQEQDFPAHQMPDWPRRPTGRLICWLAFFPSFSFFVLFLYVYGVRGMFFFFFFFFFSASASKYSCYSGTCCPFVICPLIIIIIIIITVDVAVVVGRSRRIGMTIDRLVIFPVSVLYCFFDRQ